ncbi:MAG TPA: IS4/IS5 family transposase, partial [Chloroflexia bacterium]|nr:IS4/IS5 family transposase [Chloroflexia bacterium]
ALDLCVLDWLDLSACFMDGTFASAKGGVTAVGKTKRGKGSKTRLLADSHGRPVSAVVTSAQPHAVTPP